MVLFLNFRMHNLPQRLKNIRQRLLILVQRHLSGFDVAHVQDIVYQGKEVL